MGNVRRTADLQISIRDDEMAGLLGYPDAVLPERVRAMIAEIERRARGLLAPACAYRVMRREEYQHSRYLRAVDESVLCLVTVGGDLEREVTRHKQSGELTRALLLDTYGSAAAEAAAAAANAIIENVVGARGLRCSRRFSPGYGGWPVEEQRWILPALEADTLHVTLTEGCMMNPRKSITFAVTISEDPVEKRAVDICETCGAVNCRLRHTTHKCFGERSNDALS
ncbi:MAG: hypothetical protein ACE5EO_04925 [Candidatus Krumholzibacteriia bacterium]